MSSVKIITRPEMLLAQNRSSPFCMRKAMHGSLDFEWSTFKADLSKLQGFHRTGKVRRRLDVQRYVQSTSRLFWYQVVRPI